MKNLNNKKINKIALLLPVFYFLFFSYSFAAELSFENKQVEVSVGQEFELVLSLNTKKENINAIEGKISYSSNLEVKEIHDGGSVITLWIKKPQLESGQIIFAGITPGGIIIEKGKVFSIIFRAKNSGNAIISISGARTLLNDGQGTPTDLSLNSFKFKVLSEPVMSQASFISEDKDPPAPFKLKISQDLNIFEGKKFIVFVTQDKQSGIDFYEIKEGWLGNWTRAESPYLLKNQQLNSYIYVRAVDKVGNIQTVMMPPQVVIWYMNYWFWIIIIICCVFAFIYLFIRLRSSR